MNGKETYIQPDDEVWERFSLVSERIAQICEEESGGGVRMTGEDPAAGGSKGREPFAAYFRQQASFLTMLAGLYRRIEEERAFAGADKEGRCVSAKADEEGNASAGADKGDRCVSAGGDVRRSLWESGAECERIQAELYRDILPDAYDMSYANPTYAVQMLGEQYGAVMAFLAAQIRRCIREVFRGNLPELLITMELFVEVRSCFREREVRDPKEAVQGVHASSASGDAPLPDSHEVRQIFYWHFHDYSEIFFERDLRRMADPKEDFETRLVMQADLSDLTYLYRYGAYISEDERRIAAFLNRLPDEEIRAMAQTYTEGYRIGFEVTGKDLAKKQTVQIRYPIGFERMVRAAVRNFEKMGLRVTMQAEGTPPNRQFDYDHREDRAYYLDKAYVEHCLEVRKNCCEKQKKLAAGMAGPAVIMVFGEEPFAPEHKKEAFSYTDRQRQLLIYESACAGKITNQYIPGSERSFTVIAYPLPAIGERFEEIFRETVRINTLDYVLYQKMQQKMIDVLDEADCVHITGRGANRTDLYVKIWNLSDPAKETAFENCVADVNIPVGEVFTSPVLAGTEGKLFVSQVYLRDLKFEQLELDFKDGMITDYSCANFESEEENRAYIRDNVLMHHETLPMGEFAIGTNTAAYRMARDYGIEAKLPILIAEKTGPHFAVGDTCYCHEEDNLSYNPDGKAIVARENEISALRHEENGEQKAYYNCHTDITIPYDELDRITVIRKDGTTTDLIAGGRFVLAGTEALNEPLDR